MTTAYQRHMRKKLKGKMKGKTKAQRKALFKAAAKSWKKTGKSKTKSKSRNKPRARVTKSGTRRYKAKPKSGGRRVGKRGFNTQTVKKLARIGALVLPAAGILMTPAISQEGKIDLISQAYTGYSTREKNFKLERLIQGWGPSIGVEIATQATSMIKKLIKF